MNTHTASSISTNNLIDAVNAQYTDDNKTNGDIKNSNGWHDEEEPTVLSWSNLTVSTKKSGIAKHLLDDVNGTISGGLWAIMGSSGSGKTTLLSTLARRIDTYRMRVSGDLRLNGRPYTKHILKSISGYVMQDDLVNAHLTVAETIMYTAELRLPRDTSNEARKFREAEVLKMMGITYCSNVIVGDSRNKGISGGERKRLCVAMELLTRPKLIFLDEPTSGLDSTTAMSMIQTLQSLSLSHCTVVCTIHQPSTKLFSLFQHLILMRHGKIEFLGLRSSVVSHFESIGYPCPPLTNPADHILDILSDEKNEVATKSIITDEAAVIDYHPAEGLDFSDVGISNYPSLAAVPVWMHQYCVLFRRNMQEHYHRKDIHIMNLGVTVLIATFVGMSVWRNMGTYYDSVAKRQPCLFFCVIFQGIVASLQGTHSFPLERSLMLRERASGTYFVSSYFLAKSSADFLVQLISPVIFSCVAYPLVGFQKSARKFFIFLGFMILDSATATSLATMVSCLCVSIEMSTVVLSACYEVSRLYGGWFISPLLMKSYPDWKFADTLSYIKYSFIGVAINELEGLKITCKSSQLVNGVCPITSGEISMHKSGYDLEPYSLGYCAGILVLMIISWRIGAYLALRFIKI